MSYRVQARGLEAFEGRTVYFTFVLPPAAEPQLAELTGRHQAAVKAGGFEWRARPAGPRADDRGMPLHQGYPLAFFVDLDGDGACTTKADTGGGPSSIKVDLIGMQFEYALAPPLPDPGKPEQHVCDRFQ